MLAPHTMSRKRARRRDSESEESTESTEQSYEDVINTAAEKDGKYGVVWDDFVRGALTEHRREAFRSIMRIVDLPEVRAYYIGVTRCPAHRFFEMPSPHRQSFDAMYPLLVGKGMGSVERRFIEVLRRGQRALHNMKIVGPGGERVRARGVRFLYLCVQLTSPTRTASPETDRD